MSGPRARLGASMKIAVIGTGRIGGTLGGRWRAAGHDIVYGSRTGSGEGPGGAPVMAMGEALAGTDVVLLAVPGGAAADVVAANGAALAGKVVIDAVNRIGEPEVNSRAAIAAAAPQARYVRAFNTLGWENFADPVPGTEPVFAGDTGASGTVDALLPLWFALVKRAGGNRRVALRVVQ